MKKFIMCVIVWIMFACSNVSAHTDNSGRYEIAYKYRTKKSVKRIIREILNRRKIEKFDVPNTIPIPMYDSIRSDRLKNLA